VLADGDKKTTGWHHYKNV